MSLCLPVTVQLVLIDVWVSNNWYISNAEEGINKCFMATKELIYC